MQTELDRFELLYFLEGCVTGSHLRQGVWRRCVNEFYRKLDDGDRNFIFHYAVRDLMGRERDFAREDFAKFIARFNPDNQYKVTVQGKEYDTFLFDGRYYTDFEMRIADEYIGKPEKDNKRLEMYHRNYRHLQYEIEKKIKIIFPIWMQM